MVNSLKSKIRRAAVSGLLAILGIANSCSAAEPSVYVESGIASDYVVQHGGMKKGAVNQSLVNLDFKKGFSGFVWQNFDFEEDKTNVIVLYTQYKHSISRDLSARIAFQHFFYPGGEFGNYDNAAMAGFHYSNAIDVDFDLTQLIAHDKVPNGTRYYAKLSKTLPLGKIAGTEASITPSISAAYIDNFYSSTGFSQVTPGIKIQLSKGKASFNLFVDQQFGENGFEDETIYGASLGYSF